MNWIDKLERKFGRHGGIPNLTVYIIICYVIGYLLTYMNPSLLSIIESGCFQDSAGTDLASGHLGDLSTKHR